MKNLKVSMKLLVSFGVVVAIIAVVGLVSIFNLRDVDQKYATMIENQAVPLNSVINIVGAIQSLRADSRACIIYSGDKEKIRETKELMAADIKMFEDNAALFGKSAMRADVKALYVSTMRTYDNVSKPGLQKIIEMAEQGAPQAEMVAYMNNVAKPAADLITKNMVKATDINAEMLENAVKECNNNSAHVIAVMIALFLAGIAIAVFFGTYITRLICKPLGDTVKMIKEMGLGHLSTRLRLDRKDEIGELAKTMDQFADDMQNIVIATMKQISVGDLSANIQKKDSEDEVAEALKGTIDELHALIIDDGGKVLTAAAHKDLSQRLTGHYQGVYATMKEHINTVVETLDSALCQVSDAVNQVESVSNQISGNAQGWAESASQQVNTLEVVSTNLEEMSTITMVNAKHSSLAKTLAAEARIAADHGDAAMKRMAEAIRQIKCSADDTAHIIKTIDDFADQTNILAMKATVEATRAGRAGKGFAMVADEVRKLAIRSVEAAKNTTKMIEAAVKNADGGVKITEDVAKSFGQIVDRTNTVGYLIDEIAAASAEQARDIKMVNNSVAEMSEVTQRNADNSEESAKVSEELLDRAEELSDMVSEFKLSGGNGNAKRRPKKQNQLPSTEKSDVTPNNAANNTAKVTGGWVGTAFVKSTKILKAEDIIPLDKND